MNIHEGKGSVIYYSCFTVSDSEVSRLSTSLEETFLIVGGA